MAELSTFPGVIRVERGGDVVTEITSGMANDSLAIPCAPNVWFQLASVFKQFTAAAVLIRMDDQRLSVDDPVAQFIDGCPPSWQ